MMPLLVGSLYYMVHILVDLARNEDDGGIKPLNSLKVFWTDSLVFGCLMPTQHQDLLTMLQFTNQVSHPLATRKLGVIVYRTLTCACPPPPVSIKDNAILGLPQLDCLNIASICGHPKVMVVIVHMVPSLGTF